MPRNTSALFMSIVGARKGFGTEEQKGGDHEQSK